MTRGRRDPGVWFGKGLRFNGTNQRGTIAHDAVFDKERTDAFSWGGWFRWTASGVFVLMGKADDDRGWDVHTATTQIGVALNSSFSGNNYVNVVTISTGWNDGRWHFIVVTYSGSSTAAGLHIYVDGVDQTLGVVRDTLSATIKVATGAGVGARATGSNPLWFPGEAFGAQFWSGVLTSGNVTTLYNGRAPKKSATAGTLVSKWWVESTDTPPMIVDSVSAKNMTLANTPTFFTR